MLVRLVNPLIIVSAFGFVAFAAAWSILTDLVTGVAGDRKYDLRLNSHPVSYIAIICGKVAVMGFAVAEILHTFDLVGDPELALRAIIG